MESSLPMRPQGTGTFLMLCGLSGAGIACQPAPGIAGDVVYLIDNSENSVPAYIGYGPTSTVAQANAVVPAISGVTGPSCFVVAKTTVQQFTLSGNLFMAAVNALGSGVVRTLAGFGN